MHSIPHGVSCHELRFNFNALSYFATKFRIKISINIQYIIYVYAFKTFKYLHSVFQQIENVQMRHRIIIKAKGFLSRIVRTTHKHSESDNPPQIDPNQNAVYTSKYFIKLSPRIYEGGTLV